MKKLIYCLICVFIAAGASAQSFHKGDKVLNLGIGLGNALFNGSDYKTITPPISASFEYGIIDHLFDDKSALGIGGYLGYGASKYDLGYSDYDFKYSSTVVGARSALHYAFMKKMDTYAGISLGYNFVSHKSEHKQVGSYAIKSSALYWGWFIGTRYYFTDFFGLMSEVGYEIAYLTLGLTFRF